MSICIYALVTPPRARLRLIGIGGEKLRVVSVGRVAAIVGELRRMPASNVTNLRRHAAVIDAIAARVSSILPARFGTAMADEEELAFNLRSRQTAFRERLRAVRTRTQMTIRLIAPIAESAESESGDAPFRSQSPVTGGTRLRLGYGTTQGTRYLQQRMQIGARDRALPGFEPIREAVRRYVKEERVERRGDVATVNHLIPRRAAEKYRRAVEQAAVDHDIRVVVTGPFPPYAFAENW